MGTHVPSVCLGLSRTSVRHRRPQHSGGVVSCWISDNKWQVLAQPSPVLAGRCLRALVSHGSKGPRHRAPRASPSPGSWLTRSARANPTATNSLPLSPLLPPHRDTRNQPHTPLPAVALHGQQGFGAGGTVWGWQQVQTHQPAQPTGPGLVPGVPVGTWRRTCPKPKAKAGSGGAGSAGL